MKFCETCGKDHNGSYGSGRFCSLSCARSFSTKSNRKETNKKISESLKTFYRDKVAIEDNNVNSKINKTKYKTIITTCKYCNEIIKNKHICPECKPYIQNITLFKKIGVYSDGIKLSLCNKLALDILYDEYFNGQCTKFELMKKYNLQSNTLYNFFKKNKISLRNLSQATQLAIQKHKLNLPSKNSFKRGSHISWNNREVYYRSSYELNYCKYLDDMKIDYIMENLRISYYDSQKNKTRIAIPDFYLPESNTIIEVKSNYTYNVQNMMDKFLEYRKLGYNTKLILENKEISI